LPISEVFRRSPRPMPWSDEHPGGRCLAPGWISTPVKALRASWRAGRGSKEAIWRGQSRWLNRCSNLQGVKIPRIAREGISRCHGRAGSPLRDDPEIGGSTVLRSCRNEKPKARGKVDGRRTGEGLLGRGGGSLSRLGCPRSRRPSGGGGRPISLRSRSDGGSPQLALGKQCTWGRPHQLGPEFWRQGLLKQRNWALSQSTWLAGAPRSSGQHGGCRHPVLASSPADRCRAMLWQNSPRPPAGMPGLMLTSPTQLPVQQFLEAGRARGGNH